ncbi:MAG: hypothetical protein R3A13_08300 [Bdellovibrionota bacterium]
MSRFILLLVILLPVSVLAQDLSDIQGPFYELTEKSSEAETMSGQFDPTKDTFSIEREKQNLFGNSAAIDSAESELSKFQTLFASTEAQPFIFYGGMQGTADTMQSEAMVKLLSKNLTGVLPVYLSAVAMTEPALHDSITESAAFSQRMVSQLYQQEKHFIEQLEAFPVLRRFVQERYKACVYKFTKESGGKKHSWVEAQAHCLGDSYNASDEKFKEIDTSGDGHFTKFDVAATGSEIEKNNNVKSIVSWLFDEVLNRMEKPATPSDANGNGNKPPTGMQDMIDRYKSAQNKVKAARDQWNKLIGDVQVITESKKTQEGSHIIQVRMVPLSSDQHKEPMVVVDILAKDRYGKILKLVKEKCDHENQPIPSSSQKQELTKDNSSQSFILTAEKAKPVSIEGWPMNTAELKALFDYFVQNSTPQADGKPNCALLADSGDASFDSLANTGDTKPNAPKWARSFQDLSFLHAGVIRQQILGKMWNYVTSRSGATEEAAQQEPLARVAYALLQKNSGFDSPAHGIDAVFESLSKFWARLAVELDTKKKASSSGVAESEDK